MFICTGHVLRLALCGMQAFALPPLKRSELHKRPHCAKYSGQSRRSQHQPHVEPQQHVLHVQLATKRWLLKAIPPCFATTASAHQRLEIKAPGCVAPNIDLHNCPHPCLLGFNVHTPSGTHSLLNSHCRTTIRLRTTFLLTTLHLPHAYLLPCAQLDARTVSTWPTTRNPS